MLRAMLSAVVLCMTAMPVSTDVNCGNAYMHFLERLNERGDAVSGDRLAIIHRSALRIFDACETGDMNTAGAMFRELEKS
jgi:hypothetical protein